LLRHFWALVPGGFLALLELIQRASGEAVDMPAWVFWLVLGLGLLLAAFLAFHDLRVSSSPLDARDARRKVETEIAQIITEGGVMASDSWPGIAFTEQEAWESATAWWNGAGVFIEAVLGPGERHIISEPISGSGRENLLEKHCKLLRGVLTRLPAKELRIEGQELDEAIAAGQKTGYPANRQLT
jgi:hypothetical protein